MINSAYKHIAAANVEHAPFLNVQEEITPQAKKSKLNLFNSRLLFLFPSSFPNVFTSFKPKDIYSDLMWLQRLEGWEIIAWSLKPGSQKAKISDWSNPKIVIWNLRNKSRPLSELSFSLSGHFLTILLLARFSRTVI